MGEGQKLGGLGAYSPRPRGSRASLLQFAVSLDAPQCPEVLAGGLGYATLRPGLEGHIHRPPCPAVCWAASSVREPRAQSRPAFHAPGRTPAHSCPPAERLPVQVCALGCLTASLVRQSPRPCPGPHSIGAKRTPTPKCDLHCLPLLPQIPPSAVVPALPL